MWSSLLQQAFTHPHSMPYSLTGSVRTLYTSWRTIRDMKRRKCVLDYNVYRQRYNAIRKNNLLPQELQASSTVCVFYCHLCSLRSVCVWIINTSVTVVTFVCAATMSWSSICSLCAHHHHLCPPVTAVCRALWCGLSLWLWRTDSL